MALGLSYLTVDRADAATAPLYVLSDTVNQCTLIGSWDDPSKTCTLNTDINVDTGYDAGIAITSSGITLDGNGHSLKGQGAGDGNPAGVEASLISGTITGVTVKNLIVNGFDSALSLHYCTACAVNDNTLSNNGYGMQLYGTTNSSISGNTTNDNNIFSVPITGIYLSASTGNMVSGNFAAGNGSNIELVDSSDANTISGNDFNSSLDSSGNPGGGSGISISQSGSNSIIGNVFNWNGIGINLISGGGNVISRNTLSNNLEYGLAISSAANSEVYKNNFIDNATQAVNSGSDNSFNRAAPAGGNFWSNWTSPTGSDGFVTNPYTFTGGQDNKPWNLQDGWQDMTAPTVENVIPSGTIAAVNPTISADYGDAGSGINTASVHITLDGGEITSGCAISASNASCPQTGLTYGHHSIGGSVNDLSGNSSAISGGFDILSPAKAITGFTIPNQTGATTIDESAHTISVTMPYGTNVTALVPTITHSGASIYPESGVAHDFTTIGIYTVTASDTSAQPYTVTITLADPVPEEIFLAKANIIGAPLGSSAGAATPIAGGPSMYKNYTNGRLYYNQPAGQVYWVHGALLVKYDQKNRENGSLGLPVGDEQDVTGVGGARESRFAGGIIYWGPGLGSFAMTDGNILARYLADRLEGGAGGPAYYGLPTSDVYPAWDGTAQNMQKAIFTDNVRNGTRFVRGGVMVKYQMTGGPKGYLHLIKDEEAALSPALPTHGDAVQAIFENGRVYWSGTTGSHIVNGGVYVTYMGYCDTGGCGPSSRLGLPITDEYPLALPGGGARSRFEHGFISWWIYYGSWVDVT
ncbi:MAG: NosD domain-containing protein [Thermoleophilia bacterium]|nr:NosD domain-containing protein [Thermoleophilia bacterium]